MKKLKVTIFGGPVPQPVDSVTMLVPTGKGKLAQAIAQEMRCHFSDVELIGNVDGQMDYDFPAIEQAVETLDANVVIFLPHLLNFFARYRFSDTLTYDKKIRVNDDDEDDSYLSLSETPKLLPRIKKLHPEVLLVPFKIADAKMSQVEIIKWMLDAHAAIAVYSRLGDSQRFWILDVLGNEIEVSKQELPARLAQEILHYSQVIRRRSVRISEQVPSVPCLRDFVAFSRKMRPAFTQLVEKNVESSRWPGNFSFRCSHGFMSARVASGFIITKRNVEKTGLTEKDFVFVDGQLHDGQLYFSGSPEAKPSIDAPVHRVIYEQLPWVQAIVHGHLFYNGSFVHNMSLSRWPCGAENEAHEIVSCAPKENPDLWVANIQGHGFIALIGSSDIRAGLQKIYPSRYTKKT